MTADFSSILFQIDRIADNCVFIAEETLDGISLSKYDTVETREMVQNIVNV